MMQAALSRWQVAGTQARLTMVLWWINRRLDVLEWRVRLNVW